MPGLSGTLSSGLSRCTLNQPNGPNYRETECRATSPGRSRPRTTQRCTTWRRPRTPPHRALLVRARAVILAGGEGSRLGVLTEKRAKPAVPFAGKYRIIDFTLSNCVNSGISDVMMLTQYRPHSLNDHIASGRA